MHIRSETMLGTSHSWSVTMRNLLAQFHKMGHKLYLKSTNGNELIEPFLKQFLNKEVDVPDIDLCYTLPRNFSSRFKPSSKVKMAIYNYETSIMPKMWLKSIDSVDYVLPSSNFSKQIFVNAGWPAEKCIVVPHGINLNEYSDTETKIKVSTKKSFKFLNVSIPHYRKNIDIVLDAYYSSFTEDDDVCLILKTKLEPPNKSNKFEVNVKNVIISMQKKHLAYGRKLPQVEILQNSVKNMVHLYNVCDCLVSASSAEGFGLPLLEALAANKLVIASNCTGQIDFLNKNNSLLVDVKKIPADSRYQYWIATPGATTYLPDVDSLSKSMISAYTNHLELKKKFEAERLNTIKKYTWENAAKQILEIK